MSVVCSRVVTNVWTTAALFVFDITTTVLHYLSPIGTGNHTASARRGFRILLGFRLTDYIVLFFFYVLLTVHLGIILATDQLHTQFFFYNKFIIFLYMFPTLLYSSSGGQIVLCSIWYRHTLSAIFVLQVTVL